MADAPVNKILPFSMVDGPGCRAVVFVQGCNIHCGYCHNPETQRLCRGCGLCVPGCPGGALHLGGGGGNGRGNPECGKNLESGENLWGGEHPERGYVIWDRGRCLECGRCLSVCPHHSSPKVQWMEAREVFTQVMHSVPFIRGVTVSGGECMLYPEFLLELFWLCRGKGLSRLLDSNGTFPFSGELLEICDGVMLDVKAWDKAVFKALTGAGNERVLLNLRELSDAHKLEEIRVVCLDGYVDACQVVDNIGGLIGREAMEAVGLKLIRFRPYGVKGPFSGLPAASREYMDGIYEKAWEAGFRNVVIL